MSDSHRGAAKLTRLPAEPLLARLAGISLPTHHPMRRAICRAQREGEFTVTAVDRICVRVLGVHPLDVYGADWLHAESVQEAVAG